MRRTFVYGILIFFMGCHPTTKKEDLKFLNGYWEIEKVEFSDGQTKEYNISTTIDYIKLDEMSGFRKKVQPQLNGSYRTSDDAENFKIIEMDGIFKIVYGLGINSWEEEVISIERNSFSVRNQNDKIYSYKRFEPLNPQP